MLDPGDDRLVKAALDQLGIAEPDEDPEPEEAGVIKGYAAQVDAKSVGLSVNVFMSVSLTTQTEKALKDFERRV